MFFHHKNPLGDLFRNLLRIQTVQRWDTNGNVRKNGRDGDWRCMSWMIYGWFLDHLCMIKMDDLWMICG